MPVKYFAYGSNMDPDRMREERKVFFLKRERAVLEGWRLLFNKIKRDLPGAGYANIVKDEGSIVEGVLYEIREEDLEKLDECEGYPRHYYRRKVKVRIEDGREVEALTYIANPDMTRSDLKPTRKYLRYLIRGSDILSEEYREKLQRIETLEDG